ncbi:MAG: sulfatase [Acidobacteriia bacterium]|nr:sulfatase [Terriglobia bacterium]
MTTPVWQDGITAPRATRGSVGSLVVMAAWFGIVAGMVEGTGLLLFQRINWARWGPMLHVSEPIVWISVIVDLILFSGLVIVVGAVSRWIPRVPPVRVAVFLLSAAAAYDWLTLTARLYHSSCLLLAIGVAALFTRWMKRREAGVLQFWRRTLPWLAAAAVLALVGIQGGRWWTEQQALAKLPAAARGSPNVLVIVVDTLRADHLSSYGYARATSPNIDRIAQQGVLFKNAFSSCSWSFPSHVSLLTGRYQFEHGIENMVPIPMFGSGAPDLGGKPTLGEALERRGYRTGAFSANRAWFSHDLGFGRGFTHFEDYFHSVPDMFVRTLYGREFSRIVLARTDRSKYRRALRWLGFEAILDRDDEGLGSSAGSPGVRKRSTAVNQELVQWIDRDRHRPFFAFLNYFDVHEPYGGPLSFATPDWPQSTPVDKYDDGVKYVDDSVSQLMTELERRGLAGNTIVVITADHGEELGQHGLRTHGRALYKGEIQVPLIFWYPGHVPGGVRVPMPVTISALPATLLSILGDDAAAAQFPASSLSRLWDASQPPVTWPDVLSELAQRKFSTNPHGATADSVPSVGKGSMKSLVSGQWHLIVHKNFGDQLYDWVHDPGESTNLILTPQGQATAGQLASHMQDLLAQSLPDVAAGLRASAVALHNGVPVAPAGQAHPSSPKPVNDYYQLRAEAGSIVTVEVSTQKPAAANVFDPVVAIEAAGGEPVQTCRNPGDDRIQAPGIPDPTPDAFDDVCMNDDINPGVNRDSRLELLVPGDAGSRVQMYVRVSDWDGRGGTNMSYHIAVSGMKEAPTIGAPAQ